MAELQWYYPTALVEVPPLLEADHVLPCGGNTLLLRTGLTRTKGLIDLGRLDLTYFRQEDGHYRFGATTTFAGVVSHLSTVDPESILVKSLRAAASCPLRNRITVGGSIASFPPWSDLMGPLVALDASVYLVGRNQGGFPVTEYITSSDVRKGNLIIEMKYAPQNWLSYYYRAGRTVTDYSSFNLTLLWKTSLSGQIDDIRIVLVGTRKKFRRLEELENRVCGLQITDINGETLLRDIELPFSSSKLGSADYVSHLARCELIRALNHLGRGT